MLDASGRDNAVKARMLRCNGFHDAFELIGVAEIHVAIPERALERSSKAGCNRVKFFVWLGEAVETIN